MPRSGLLSVGAATATLGLAATAHAQMTVCIANGTDETADGYLKVCPGAYGSWTSDEYD